MSSLPPSISRVLALCGLAFALVFVATNSRAQEHSTNAAETPPPATAVPAQATSEPLPGESTYQQLKQDLFKPFETWKSGSATQPVLATRPVAPPASLKQSEQTEKERNWMINGMNELNSASKHDELQKLSNPMSTWGERNKSSIEKYYEQSGRNTGATNTLNDMINAWTRDPSGLNALNPMNFMIPGSEQLLRSMILPWETNSYAIKSDTTKDSTAQDKADQERDERNMQEFKHMIDPTFPAPPPRGYNPAQDPFAALNALMNSTPGSPMGRPATAQLPGYPAVGAMSPVLGAANPATGAFQLPTTANAPIKPIFPETVQKLLAQPEKPVMVKPVDPASLMPRRKF